MSTTNTTCGEIWPGEDWLPPCHLEAGHEGEHTTTVTWPQYVPRPVDEAREPSPMERLMHTAWASTLAEAMRVVPMFAAQVEGSERAVNRDAEQSDRNGA